MSANAVLSFDPGLDGGMALLCDDAVQARVLPTVERRVTRDGKLKMTREYDIWSISKTVRMALGSFPDLVVAIERVAPMPSTEEWGKRAKTGKPGRFSHGSIASFKLGQGFGLLIGLVAGCGVSHDRLWLVSPVSWCKEMLKFGGKGKDRAKVACSRLFPELDLLASPQCRVAHSGMADAVLIGEWVRRRISSGEEQWTKRK